MTNKSTISNLEHKFLFVASSIVPLLFVAAIFFTIYDSYFPLPPSPPIEQNTTFFISNCRLPPFLEKAFLVSFLTCGFLTSIFVFSRFIFHSWFVLFFPLILFIFYFIQIISSYFHRISYPAEGFTEPGLFFDVPSVVLIFGGITIFLFLWHTKVIIQDRIRDRNLNLNLP